MSEINEVLFNKCPPGQTDVDPLGRGIEGCWVLPPTTNAPTTTKKPKTTIPTTKVPTTTKEPKTTIPTTKVPTTTVPKPQKEAPIAPPTTKNQDTLTTLGTTTTLAPTSTQEPTTTSLIPSSTSSLEVNGQISTSTTSAETIVPNNDIYSSETPLQVGVAVGTFAVAGIILAVLRMRKQ